MTLTALSQTQFGAAQKSGAEWPEREEGGQCVSNISPAEQRKRLASGIISSAIALAILVMLLAVGADRLWRLALLPVFLGAANGYFQWRDKT